jgi:hypothetical protein
MELTHTALFWRCPEPPLMGQRRIGADSEHVTLSLAELRDPTAQCGQLGGSDEGKVTRVEKQDEPTVQIVLEGYLPRSRAGAVNAR